MEHPNWDTDDISVTEAGEELFSSIKVTLFFDTVQDAIKEATEAGLEQVDEGTYRVVFSDPTDEYATGDVVIKFSKNQSGYQMNQEEFFGRERAPDWLRPYLAPVFGDDNYVVMPRCETDISDEEFLQLSDYFSQHDERITESPEFHHKNVGRYDGVPVVFDFAVGYILF